MADKAPVAVAGPDLIRGHNRQSFQGGSSIKYFEKRIEFVPARKPFSGLTYGGGDFKIETLNPGGPDPSGGGQGSGQAAVDGEVKKGDGSEAFDGLLDPELSLRVSFQRIGAGLENLGNTCFLNSVLQCLTYTEPLAAYLQSGKHQSSCRINGFCALCAIQKHVSRSLKASGRIVAPKDLVANLRCISRTFRNARQEDAHEYMVNLLESMHKCCLPSGVPSESPGAYEKSLVHRIFGGRLRSQVKCLQCGNCSNKFDPFLDLSLEIANAASLQKAMRHFTAPEQLDGGERQYQCQKCKQKVRALKQLTVHKAPYVLTIHLKRFHSLNPGQKINKDVQFDTSLDLKPFMSDPKQEGDLKYSLYGVLVHHGWSTRSGHYYCYVRTSTNLWYSLDDNQVRQVSESTVLQQKAYMLFYVRSRNSTPRKLVETVRKENLRENNYSGNRVSTFNFGQNPSRAVQVTQLADKCSAMVSSSTPVIITTEAVRVCSVKESEVTVSDPKDPRKLETAANSNLEAKIVNDGVSGDSVKESTISNETGETGVEQVTGHETGGKVTEREQVIGHETAGKVTELEQVIGPETAGKVTELEQVIGPETAGKVTELEQVIGPETAGKITELEQAIGHETAGKVTELSHKIDCASSANNLNQKSSQVGSLNSKKLKKKQIKYQLASVHFGANRLLRASLGLRKKRMKRKRHGTKNVTIDSGPSTSEVRRPVSSAQTKKATSSTEKGVDKRPEGNINSDGGSSTDAVHADTKVINDVKDCKNDMENGLMSMLTRGLEETLAQWDGVDLPPSPVESDGAGTAKAGNAIGYVLDEWDEEYDRGKRKKVRQSQHDFGGPNYFQEIASQKIKSKKARFDRATAGNGPFRI